MLCFCGTETLNSHGASVHLGVQMGTGECNAGGNPAIDLHPMRGDGLILLVASCYRNRNKLWPDGLQGLIQTLLYLTCLAFLDKLNTSLAIIIWAVANCPTTQLAKCLLDQSYYQSLILQPLGSQMRPIFFTGD